MTTYLLTYLLTYLITPWSRVLIEKLTGLQVVKKFPASFYGIQRFITACISAYSPIQNYTIGWVPASQNTLSPGSKFLMQNLPKWVVKFKLYSGTTEYYILCLFRVV